MGARATTEHPDEVREMFELFARQLEVYADDQIASLRWNTGVNKRDAQTRAEVYRSVSAEMREIVFEKVQP